LLLFFKKEALAFLTRPEPQPMPYMVIFCALLLLTAMVSCAIL
jgi:hypothetical protein